MQHDGLDATFGWYLPHFDLKMLTAKRYAQVAGPARAAQAVQDTIGWRGNTYPPVLQRQRPGQVAYNIAYTADLPAGQRTVLRREENDLPSSDTGGPISCGVIAGRAFRG